jgi:hypothetical protein
MFATKAPTLRTGREAVGAFVLAGNPHYKASEKSRILKFGGVCYDVLSLTDHLA